jgi:hypothetical protein
MNHKSLIFLGMLSLAAVAYADPPTSSNAPANAADSQDASTPAKDNRNCLKSTGSMVQRKDGCTTNGANGQTYDQDDIRRTGATNTSSAIRELNVNR